MQTQELVAGRELDALIAERVFGLKLTAHDWPCGYDEDTNEYCAAIWPQPPDRMRGFTQRDIAAWNTRYPDRGPVYENGVIIPVPFYSTDIAAAWDVFTHNSMTGQIIGYNVQDPAHRSDLTEVDELGYAREWLCTANGRPIHAPTAPLAICRAALLALEARP